MGSSDVYVNIYVKQLKQRYFLYNVVILDIYGENVWA